MHQGVFTTFAVSIFLIVYCPLAGAREPAEEVADVDVGDEDSIQEFPDISFAGEVTVTGSLIPRADLTALSPVTVMEVPTELTYSGTVRIEEAPEGGGFQFGLGLLVHNLPTLPGSGPKVRP